MLLILGLSTALVITLKVSSKRKAEAERNYTNLQNSAFTIKELKAKNDSTYYEINQLIVDKETLEMLNAGLVNQITNLNTKLKNLTAVTAIALQYNVRIDSVPIYVPDTTNRYGRVSYNDNYVSLAGAVDWKEKSFEDINIVVTDSILIITETVYKGCWFWKRPKYTKIKLSSANPYLILKNVESYNLKF